MAASKVPKSLSTAVMRRYLRTSISSLNQNKLNGLLAEVDFRRHIAALGFADRVSLGGWIARSVGAGAFGRSTVALFPEILPDGSSLTVGRPHTQPNHGLHTICSTFHQIGISSLFCSARVERENDAAAVAWDAIELGVPSQQPFRSLEDSLAPHLSRRVRVYNHLRYRTNTNRIPEATVAEEFLKEHLRVSFQRLFMSEISDVDGILWGKRLTYPIEVKEKTAAPDRRVGPYFGIDVGPFVKLAFYAAKRGNLHSLFVVREIVDVETRALKQWWFITFDRLAQFASWTQQGGGTNMQGGGSSVVKVPLDQFLPLTKEELERL